MREGKGKQRDEAAAAGEAGKTRGAVQRTELGGGG